MEDYISNLNTEEDYEKFLEYIFSQDTVAITDEKIMEAINLYLSK